MPIIILEPIRRPPPPNERRGALAGFAWCFVILAAIGLARYAWLKRKAAPPAPPIAAALESAPSDVAESPQDVANREADQALDQMGVAEGLLKQLFPTLDKPAAVATLVKRFELDPENERRFLSLIRAMEERREFLETTVHVHKAMVASASRLRDGILDDVRAGGPLGSPKLRDLWREAIEAEVDVDLPEGGHAQKIYDRVATHQLVQRFDVAKQVAAYRRCAEAIRRLAAVNEPLRRLSEALPEEVREKTFWKIPREGADPYFDRQAQAGIWGNYLTYNWGCGSGLFWLFEYSNLDPRMVHDDFELAAQDLERLLMLRQPLGRVVHEFKSAHRSPPGPVPRRDPEPTEGEPSSTSTSASPAPPPRQPLEDLPDWMGPRAAARAAEPAPPEPQPVKKRRPRRGPQLDPRDLFRW